MNPESLIQLILNRCTQERMLPPLKTRLVKLVYLTELEYYRRTRRRLTNLDWRFHHFGPYAFSLASYVGDPDTDNFPSEFQRVAMADLAERDKVASDHDTEQAVADVVRQWGDADINALLDYVYFETEPMQSARRGDHLDFSLVLPLHSNRRVVIKLDEKRLKDIRTKLAARASSYEQFRRPTVGSDELFENLREWDSERTPNLRQGECKINPKDLVPPDEG